MTSLVASSAYFLKFSLNRPPNLVTSSLKSAAPVQDFAGLSSSEGTSVQDVGTERLKVSYVSYSALASSPEWMASRIARVYFNLYSSVQLGQKLEQQGLRATLSPSRSTSTNPTSIQQPCISVVVCNLIS